MTKVSVVRFLLVDDNPFDVRLLRTYFADSLLRPDLHVVDDGQLALDFILAVSAGREPSPDLVILDLNLPKRSGFEVLAEMRATSAMASVPVIVLSTSRSPDDAALAERLGARYLRKPSRLDGYREIVAEIERYFTKSAGA
jgi:DNA-binding response OmpR family regulator